MSPDTPAKNRSAGRFTRLRVLLASALVFGVGASVTLAAWSDSETAQATFTAGAFGIVGSTTGNAAEFVDHGPGTPAAALSFSLAPTAMVPGTVTYALYSVRTIPNSVAGALTMAAAPSNVTPDNLGSYLRYSVRTVPSTACNSDATFKAQGSAEVVPADSTLATGSAVPLPIGADGAQVNYCFRIILPASTPNAAQGKSVAAAWTITAEAAAPPPAP